MITRVSFLLIALTLLLSHSFVSASTEHFLIAGSDGVHLVSLDSTTGKFSKHHKATDHTLTWMTHPAKGFIYAGSTLAEPNGLTDGAASAYRITAGSKLEFLNQLPTTGKTPVQIASTPNNKHILVANFRTDEYTSQGCLTSFSTTKSGTLKKVEQRFTHPGKGGSKSNRQLASHPHSIMLDPYSKYAAVGDLGIDKILIYQVIKKSPGLTYTSTIQGLPGQQPRHVAWHPDGKTIYCMNEATPTVSVASFDRDSGKGEFIQHIKRTKGNKGGGADIQITHSGKFVYGSNRGEDTIVMFKTDDSSGELSLIEHASSGGKSTRSLRVSTNDQWLLAAHMGSNLITLFKIDQETGRLTAMSSQINIPAPACIVSLP